MSTAAVPSYVYDRVRRPPGVFVVPGSTPVVAFGNARQATTATVGINPSRAEFLDRLGAELDEDARRLETLASLGVESLTEADIETVSGVVRSCDGYFARNPYRRWFDQLEFVLAGIGESYYDGSACHLDLVQWATDPVWGKLEPRDRMRLLDADREFFVAQLENEQIERLLLNGRAVVETCSKALNWTLEVVGTTTFGRSRCELFSGAIGSVSVAGWSVNLQSSFGVTKALRASIRDWVASALPEAVDGMSGCGERTPVRVTATQRTIEGS